MSDIESSTFPVPTQYRVYRFSHHYVDGRVEDRWHAFEHVTFGSGVITSNHGTAGCTQINVTLLGQVQAESPALAVQAALVAEEV